MNILPLWIIAGSTCVLFLLPALGKRFGFLASPVAALGAASALIAVLLSPQGEAFGGALTFDRLTRAASLIVLGASLLAAIGAAHETRRSLSSSRSEYFGLCSLATLGMLLVVSANELITLFVAFETMSVPLYVLAAIRRDRDGAEAGLKFLLVGAVSSAVLLFALSLVFGVAGSTSFEDISLSFASFDGRSAALIFALLVSGLGFKIAAVPFHTWAPDTYQAAPTPFVAFLSVAPKAAGIVLLMRLFGVFGESVVWLPLLLLCTASIAFGNLMALPQKNVKRMLAYSGIAHVGYILIAVLAGGVTGQGAALFYLAAYVATNMLAFTCVSAVGRAAGSDDIDAMRGMWSGSPVLAVAFLLSLLSLGGIPFLVGFWGKLYVFIAGIGAGRPWSVPVVLLGGIFAVVALFYYLMVAKRMYIDKGEPLAVKIPLSEWVVITVTAALTVGMGVFPSAVTALLR